MNISDTPTEAQIKTTLRALDNSTINSERHPLFESAAKCIRWLQVCVSGANHDEAAAHHEATVNAEREATESRMSQTGETMSSDIDARLRQAKVIYSEDECAPDAESVQSAYARLFGDPMPNLSLVNQKDLGDCIVYEIQRDRFVVMGPPRSGLTEIRVLNPTVRKELHTELDWQNNPVPPDETPETIIKIWVITPGTSAFDETWVRGYAEAVNAAQEILAQSVDDADEVDAKIGISVKMRLREVGLWEYREARDNDE